MPTKKPPATTLGSRIRAARLAAALTQVQFAEQAGITQAYLSDIEVDKTEPSLATLRKIAAALGLAAGDLLGK